MSDFEAIIRWLVALTVISMALGPAIWWLASGLGAALHGLIRPLAPVIATAALWWPAALVGVPFTATTLIIVVIVAGAMCWLWWLRSGFIFEWKHILGFEALWITLFFAYSFFRTYNPDIANTEKPMEIALLSSVSRSAEVPAPDPWFAGEIINYYYFGYQVFGGLVKLSGVPPTIAFNLALATLFASVGTAAVAIGVAIARSAHLSRVSACLSGALVAFLVLLAGNLETAWRFVRNPGETVGYRWWYDGVGWQASRVIVDHGVHGNPDPRDTINEFPAFSFVLGDLHPHVLTFPHLVAIVALTLGIVLRPLTATLPRVAAIGALAGLLYASNSWDAPLGVGLLAGGILLTASWQMRDTWIRIAAILLASIIAALPFMLRFTAPIGLDQSELPDWARRIPLIEQTTGTLGIVTWHPSGWGELLLVHGPWIAGFLVLFALAYTVDETVSDTLDRWTIWLTGAVLLSVLVALLWAPGVLLLGIPLIAACCVVTRSRNRVIRPVAALFAAGFFLILVPEFVYIQDAFGDRMNTIFKLYFQAWLLLGVATGATFVLAISTPIRWISRGSIVVAVVTLLAVTPYLPISARDWTSDFESRRGLDGMGYIERIAPAEHAAIQWLSDNVPENAAIVEGPGCSYLTVAGIPTNRFSAFGGVTTIVGWAGHEHQWRRGDDDPIRLRVEERQDFANEWLDGSPPSRLDVPAPDFIVLGNQERLGSESCGSLIAHDVEASRNALESIGWQSVFERDNVVILAR